MTIKLRAVLEFDDQQWNDHVFGSGAFQWEWWYNAIEISGDRIWLTAFTENGLAEIPDDSKPSTKFWIGTMQDLADKASLLASEDSFVMNQLVNDDFDADGMDRVCQYAVFGEVRYG